MNNVYNNTFERYKVLYTDPDMGKGEFEKILRNDYSRFNGKGDFAHMFATLATGTNSNSAMFADVYTSGKTYISSGYYGDVTDIADAASMSGDDYIADLDSDNLYYRIMNSNDNFMNTFNRYTQGVISGNIRRSKEFLNNNKGVDNIKKILYGDDLDPESHSWFFVDDDRVDSNKSKVVSENFLDALGKGVDSFEEFEKIKEEK